MNPVLTKRGELKPAIPVDVAEKIESLTSAAMVDGRSKLLGPAVSTYTSPNKSMTSDVFIGPFRKSGSVSLSRLSGNRLPSLPSEDAATTSRVA